MTKYVILHTFNSAILDGVNIQFYQSESQMEKFTIYPNHFTVRTLVRLHENNTVVSLYANISYPIELLKHKQQKGNCNAEKN